MWQRPAGSFQVTPLGTAEPEYRSNERLKRLFGQKLQQGIPPLDAALELLSDANAAVWVSDNWPNDPIVMEVKQEKAGKPFKFLDKEQVADKVLAFYEQKDPSGTFFAYEGKERLAALKLYADICGYIAAKVEVDASTKNFDTKVMSIRLVSPEKKVETIEAKPIPKINENVLPLKVKLVS